MTNKYQQLKQILTSQKKFHISLGLDRISKILSLLGNPQEKLKIIQIAGTNGKGSTSRILSEILLTNGYNVALFTSPHIHRYNERIKINNQNISDDDFLQNLELIENLAQKNNIELTEFELLTAIGFNYFAQKKVDIAIIETGLGGRFDATNVCKKNLLSIITSISKDHTERLGKTISKIAFEKAGIIKKNYPVLISKNNKGRKIIETVANDLSSEIIYPNSKIKILFENNINYAQINGKKYEFSLLGLYQKENLKLVLKACEILKTKNYKITDKNIETALKNVKWECRFEWHKEKNIIIDGAHNPSGTKKLRKSLNFYFPNQTISWLYGSLKNKDYIQNMKNLFNEHDKIYFYQFEEKCLSFEEFKSYYPHGQEFKNLEELKKDNNLIVIAGSLYMPTRLSIID